MYVKEGETVAEVVLVAAPREGINRRISRGAGDLKFRGFCTRWCEFCE